VRGDIDRDKIEQARANRNAPKYDQGQGSGDDMDDGWSFSSGEEDMDFENSFGSIGESENVGIDLGDSFSGSQFAQPQVPSTPQKSSEEVIFDGVVAGGKVAFKGAKELADGVQKGLEGSNALHWCMYGRKVIVVSAVVSVASLLLKIISLITGSFSSIFWVLVGGLISLMSGLIIFTFNFENSREIKTNEYGEPQDINDYPDESAEEPIDWGDDEDFQEGEDTGESEIDWGSDDMWGDEDEEVEDTSWNVVNESIVDTVEEAINNIKEIPVNTHTRAYLYEEYIKILPKINPTFSKMRQLDDEGDEFLEFASYLDEASKIVGVKEGYEPFLEEVRENDLIVQLKITRPKGLNLEQVANELADMSSKDSYGKTVKEGVYATFSTVGSSAIINIFKGENCIVSIADTYLIEKDFVLDTNNKMPIVFGVDESGDVWKFDAENVFSYIISGKPRSGKSWAAITLIVQLVMYSTPDEINFEVFDVKAKGSDYYYMSGQLPHFTYFESDPIKITQRLEYLLSVEVPRRKEYMGKYGVTNIKDLKKMNPDVKLPYIYIVVDEMVGLNTRLDKIDKNAYTQFRENLQAVITEAPNIGFRVILIPHRITDKIIPKTIYTMVGFTACVRSDMSEIKAPMNVTPSSFPYSFPKQGDMALKTTEINADKAVYSHGLALAKDEQENRAIYRYIGSLWSKTFRTKQGDEEKQYGEKEAPKNVDWVDDVEDDTDESFWDEV
jgi:S-DNA-T family DNA segregation ATPase FtsK/SpoIIIE